MSDLAAEIFLANVRTDIPTAMTVQHIRADTKGPAI